MEVYKFGGASVKDAESVKNAGEIVSNYTGEKLVVVISAMGKTTNALEKIVSSYLYQKEDLAERVKTLRNFHHTIINELFDHVPESLNQDFEKIFGYLNKYLSQPIHTNKSLVYDQIVPIGELLSTKIVSAYLTFKTIPNEWIDARKLVLTDDQFQRAEVDWEFTKMALQQLEWDKPIYLTQGFIGGTKGSFMTTLGREGSDFSAAIFANCLNAKGVTIWKDVEGVLNADPKFFNNTEKLDEISYKEAIELAYYGASVIHPKTIKPLQNKNIPLYVRSFVDPQLPGTKISDNTAKDGALPCYIFKSGQVLISFSSKDFSFIEEEQIGEIFNVLGKLGLGVRTMQNSAINFSIATDFDEEKIEKLLKLLKEKYTIRYNDSLDLLTIRHYTEDIIKKLVGGRKVLVEQRSRNTVRLLLKP